MKLRVYSATGVALLAALATGAWANEKGNDPALIASGADPVVVEASAWEAPRAPWPGPDGYGYVGQTCTFNWIDITATGTAIVGLADDNFVGPFPIGFTFPYYGTDWTDFYVGSNGFLSFGAGSSALSNQCPLPSATTPDNVIALLWDDINFNTSGTAHYQTFGSCPFGTGQCLVVQFTNTAHYGGAAGSAGTWEAILFASGVVRLQYQDSGIEEGSGSTTGIENADAASDYGLTYACDTAASVSDDLCLEMGLLPGVFVTPDPLVVGGCSGVPQVHGMSLFNNTGAPGTFDMTYDVTSGTAFLSGPAQVAAGTGATEPFDVELMPPFAVGPQSVVATVTADGNGFTDTATIDKTVYAAGASLWTAIATEPNLGRMDNVLAPYDGKIWSVTGYSGNADVRSYDPALDSWTTIAGSAPAFGVNYARSGCAAGDEVFVYGDSTTPGFAGLWSYDMAGNAWSSVTPSGAPPAQAGIWSPSWVRDPETGFCYMTGGATLPGAGNLATVYVYDPAANAWLTPLPNFTSVRDFHAAFVYHRTSDGHKLLCVAGGNNNVGMTSTQCYDFTAAAWNAENADLGALPMGDWWAMGYTDKVGASGHQLWMTGGVLVGALTNAAWYYDVVAGNWVDGGPMINVPVYRTAAVTLDNEVYKVGGSIGSFTYTGLADRNLVCPPDSMPFADGFESGDTTQWTLTVN